MKILHIIDSLNGVGGAEVLLAGIIEGMTEHEHTIVTLYEGNVFTKQTKNAPHICLNLKGKWHIPFCIIQLKKIIQSINPDIVHSQLYWATIVARLATDKKTTMIFTLQATMSDVLTRKIYVWLEKWTYKKEQVLLSASQSVLDDYAKMVNIGSKQEVIHNYVEDIYYEKRCTPQPQNTLRVVCVGRLVEQKNYQYLFEAAKDLINDPVEFYIYGIGHLKEQLSDIISTQQLKVTLLGYEKEVYAVLPKYDVYLMCSSFEGFGIAAAEAMAIGLPVILSDIPVLKEVGGDAIYCDLADSNTLKTIIHKILLKEIDLTAYRNNGIEQAKKYTKKNYFEKLNKIYLSNKPVHTKS